MIGDNMIKVDGTCHKNQEIVNLVDEKWDNYQLEK